MTSKAGMIIYIAHGYSDILDRFWSYLYLYSIKDIVREGSIYDEVELQRQGTKLYYTNSNYTMILEATDETTENGKNIFNVTIRTGDKEESYSECILGYDDDADTIITFYDGYIAFESTDEKINGFYNNEGKKSEYFK